MAVSCEEQIDPIGHRAYQRPAQKAHPASAPDQPPRQHGDIEAIQQATIGEFAMQDAIGLNRVYVGKAFREIGGVDVLQIKTLCSVETLQMLHLPQTQGAEPIVEDAQGGRFWCEHGCELPILVQGSQASTSEWRRRISLQASRKSSLSETAA